MTLSRRSFLTRAGLAGLGLAASSGLARPLAALAESTDLGAPVEGPLADVYGRYGVPRGLSVSLAERAGARTVTWFTTGAADPGSRLQVGAVPVNASDAEITSGRLLTREITGSVQEAPFAFGRLGRDGFGVPADGEQPVLVHRATFDGLREGERLAYRVGGSGLWSPVQIVRPAPRGDQAFTFAHFGDHGVRTSSRRLTAAVAAHEPDFALVAGDISYADGRQPVWDRWFNEVEPLAARFPLVTSPGNHESNDFNGETYRRRFNLPGRGRNWFSVDYGNLHLVSTTAGCFLSAEEPESARHLLLEELLWLEQDLAVAAARRAAGEIDFIAVTQHFPTYTDHRTRGPYSPELVLLEEHILQRYQVDLLLVGHDHMYQRSRPMAYGVPTAEQGGDGAGYVEIIAGGGGQSLYEFTPVGTFELAFDPANPRQRRALWLAAAARAYSYVVYTVDGPEITGVVYGWDDVEGQNDIPPLERYEELLVGVPADEVDPDLAPRELDRFTITRKPGRLLRDLPVRSLGVADLVRRLPEVRGRIRKNLVEDCTRHQH
jgi:acid phosphatase type 7